MEGLIDGLGVQQLRTTTVGHVITIPYSALLVRSFPPCLFGQCLQSMAWSTVDCFPLRRTFSIEEIHGRGLVRFCLQSEDLDLSRELEAGFGPNSLGIMAVSGVCNASKIS